MAKIFCGLYICGIMKYAYVNGKILPAHKAMVSIFDRGLVLGDGLFETLRAVDYTPEFFLEHFSRLKRSARRLKIPLPAGKGELLNIIFTLCKKSRLKDAAVRITLTRGQYSGGLSVTSQLVPSLFISVSEVELSPVLYQKGVKA